jgi:hypothetical protein
MDVWGNALSGLGMELAGSVENQCSPLLSSLCVKQKAWPLVVFVLQRHLPAILSTRCFRGGSRASISRRC